MTHVSYTKTKQFPFQISLQASEAQIKRLRITQNQNQKRPPFNSVEQQSRIPPERVLDTTYSTLTGNQIPCF